MNNLISIKNNIFFKTALFLFAGLVLIGCSKSDTSSNAYQGNWSGTITGDFVGTWNGNISPDGVFTGVATTTDPVGNYTMSGSVSENGNLIVVTTLIHPTIQINLAFVGNLSANSGNGTWVFNGAGVQGTWNATKQ